MSPAAPGAAVARVDQVGVVIPAHDEAELLPACLAALERAVAGCPLPVEVLVVLDSCTDGTAAVARRAGASTMSVAVRSVGASRRAGMDQLCRQHPAHRLWLATTDADSEVPPDWLAGQLRLAAAGVDAVVGTVDIADWAGLSPVARAGYQAAYTAVPGHPHVHGANLGVHAATYLRVGGMPPVAEDEDVAFVDALDRAGAVVARVAHLTVTTSARRTGRTRGGFAGLLHSYASGRGPLDRSHEEEPVTTPSALVPPEPGAR